MALELSPAQTLRQSATVETVGLHSLSGRFRNHRGRHDQTRILLCHPPILQALPRRSRLVGKGYLLSRKVLAHVGQQMLHTIRQTPRFQASLLIGKGHRNTPLVYVQSGKDFVVPRDEGGALPRRASLGQWLSVPPLYTRTRCTARHPSYKSQDKLCEAIFARIQRLLRRLAAPRNDNLVSFCSYGRPVFCLTVLN